MGTPSILKASQLAIGAAGTAIGSYTDRFEFNSITPGGGVGLIDTSEEATRGTRSRSKERVAQGLIETTLNIVLNPSPAELDILLPMILGGAESVDSFPLAETTAYKDILVDWSVHRQIYQDCLVNRAEFSSSQGQPLRLSLEFWCRTQDTPVATAFPSIAVDTDNIYVHHQGVLTARSAARDFSEASVVIDNNLERSYNNAQNPTFIFPTDRVIELTGNVPFTSDEDDLYTGPLASAAGAAGTLVYTNGGQSLTFTFGNLKEQDASPPAMTGGETRQSITWRAYKSGSTAELAVTHDSSA
jgi:hypothetical protein